MAQAPSGKERIAPPGEGVICAWAIYSLLDEVGSRCFPGRDPAHQAELKRSVAQLDSYVARNAKDLSADEVAKFKRDQARVGAPKELLCRGDPLMMYEAFRDQDPAELRRSVDAVVARDGAPTWGTCF